MAGASGIGGLTPQFCDEAGAAGDVDEVIEAARQIERRIQMAAA